MTTQPSAPALRPDALGLLTFDEAAALADVTPATVRQWARRYHLTKVRVEGTICLVESEVLDCERDRRRSGRRGGGSRPRTTQP